jgi:hypothetical protein
MTATGSSYTYKETLAASERVAWRIEDVMGKGKSLNFARPFLPEALARVRSLDFLLPPERRALNQIRGHAYLSLFGIVEELILPFVLDHARPRLRGDDDRVRALLQFAGEEAKHIELFKRFRAEFERGFKTPCGVIGPADEIAREVLSRSPLAVAITVLHIEWMTHRHYLECIRDDDAIDPLFKSLLEHHWLDEAQHAKLDTLMVEALAAESSPSERTLAVEEYLDIVLYLDSGLARQSRLDLESLERATGCSLNSKQKAALVGTQHQASRFTYLGSGMTHPGVLATIEQLGPGLRERLAEVAQAFC